MKQDAEAARVARGKSPPTRGRGLKLWGARPVIAHIPSPPTRGRGLKQKAGANYTALLSRPPRGGVD